jgi:hypothetical protein
MRSAALVPVWFEKIHGKEALTFTACDGCLTFDFPSTILAHLYLRITHRLFHFSLEVQ